jgi:hypothetical protein
MSVSRILIAPVLISIASCSSWVAQRLPPAAGVFADTARVHEIRVRTGPPQKLTNVTYAEDSLRGVALRTRTAVSIAITDIERLQTRRFDGAKTAALISGMVLVAVIANLVVAEEFQDECCF